MGGLGENAYRLPMNRSELTYCAERRCSGCGKAEMVEAKDLKEALQVYTQVWYCPDCNSVWDGSYE